MTETVTERTRSGRAYVVTLCCGVMVAAVVAWIVGGDLSDRYSPDTYDALVGGSGIVAAICALLALPRARWAAIPLVAAVAVAALMAYARFSEPAPGDNPIDLTPLLLPPVILILGGLALIMASLAPERTSRHD